MIAPIPFITPTKPSYVTHLPGIQPVLMDELRNEIEGNQVVGSLCIKFPWPGMARTIGNATTNDLKILISPLLSRKNILQRRRL
jgi:acyl-coenzyme A synthetase/AMP-(fatty) acid ligase